MRNVVYPPLIRMKPVGASRATLFLGGTIDMGDSPDWQAAIIEKIGGKAEFIYNPRRPEWDVSWVQSNESVPFNPQVHWELEMIERADIVLLHFEPGSKSPVTMAEFGLCCVMKPAATIVCCPEGFWRKGNIEIMCERYGVRMVKTLDAAASHINNLLDLHQASGR